MMNFFFKKKSITQKNQREKKTLIKSQKKCKSTRVNQLNIHVKSWDHDNPLKEKQRKPWILF